MHPYKLLGPTSFWKNSVENGEINFPPHIYKKKLTISRATKIATAGSCFAQHVGRSLREHGFNVLDFEPAPRRLPDSERQAYGYDMYSARYGNIYTTRQLVQLLREAFEISTPSNFIWRDRNGRYIDALRPTIEPEGFESIDEVRALRQFHIKRVRELFQSIDVFVFTLGLTECWTDSNSGTVFPIAPGVVAGSYSREEFTLQNLNYTAILDDLREAIKIINLSRSPDSYIKTLLTVSPVPLAATAIDRHVIVSTVYSKSVLRAAVGFVADEDPLIDYFPSYELICNPWANERHYASDLRTVLPASVARVMNVFCREHCDISGDSLPSKKADNPQPTASRDSSGADIVCEEILLAALDGSEQQ